MNPSLAVIRQCQGDDELEGGDGGEEGEGELEAVAFADGAGRGEGGARDEPVAPLHDAGGEGRAAGHELLGVGHPHPHGGVGEHPEGDDEGEGSTKRNC